MPDSRARPPNRLVHESSPYLRQHAGNPVDWYPWGEEALEKARREDKPIFLSIGYSACHWCHVMERESFEDEQIASLLNANFVPVKVDREERPDLDEIYMAAVQLMTGHGGWPMSVWLTPELKPFFGGTYFPPEDRWGRPGFRTVLERVAQVYRDERSRIETGAAQVSARIASFSDVPAGHGLLSRDLLSGAVEALLRSADPVYGGFGGAPKFPHPMGVRLLLRHDRSGGDFRPLEAAVRTLDRMAAGGIYDHLGGGFHRYSTDARWLVPHFEKMLYDQALLVPAYLEGFQVTGSRRHRDVVTETLDYVLRDMTSPDGAFYSTEDADSEGEEGRFYTWTPDEVRAFLGGDASLFAEAYDVTEEGNFEGRSILHRTTSAEELSRRTGRAREEIEAALEASRRKLREARASRPRPFRDEKVLAGWNGLIISALARAGAVLSAPRYVRAAGRAADSLLSHLMLGDRLCRVFHDGKATVPAYLEDYAYLVDALVDLYQADFDRRWLGEALRLAEVMIRDFADPSGGFFNTGEVHRDLLVRVKNAQDGSTPSGNSTAATALLRLGRLTGREDLERAGEGTLRSFQALMEHAPGAFHQMLLALDLYLGPREEIVLVGTEDRSALDALLAEARRPFLPRALIVQVEPEGMKGDHRPLGSALLAGKTAQGGRPAAYVCRDFTCEAPVAAPEALARLLAETARGGV